MPVTAHPLYVPVIKNRMTGVFHLRTARDVNGGRTGLAFTSQERLTLAMGHELQCTQMCEAALRQALNPIGITLITVDPEHVGPAAQRIPGVVSAGAPPAVSCGHSATAAVA